jgi:hypothetical protein
MDSDGQGWSVSAWGVYESEGRSSFESCRVYRRAGVVTRG